MVNYCVKISLGRYVVFESFPSSLSKKTDDTLIEPNTAKKLLKEMKTKHGVSLFHEISMQ